MPVLAASASWSRPTVGAKIPRADPLVRSTTDKGVMTTVRSGPRGYRTWPVVTLLVSCSGDDAADAVAPNTAGQASTTVSTKRPTTMTTVDPREAVLADYQAFWDDMVAVGATANWRSPRMDDHATGEALAQAQAPYRSLRQRGLVARGTVKVRAKVLTVKGTTATVRRNGTWKVARAVTEVGKCRR
jgi:hypothetical protein